MLRRCTKCIFQGFWTMCTLAASRRGEPPPEKHVEITCGGGFEAILRERKLWRRCGHLAETPNLEC